MFSRRFLEALCKDRRVKRAEIDLDSSNCRIDFQHEQNSPNAMAEAFVEAIQSASASSQRKSWWSGAGRWSSLKAYRTEEGVSLWETRISHSESVKLIHSGVPGSREAAVGVKEKLAGVAGIQKCRVSAWNPQMTIVCRNGQSNTAEIIDQLESILETKSFAHPLEKESPKTDLPKNPRLAHGWKRLRYGVLAGGSFVLSIVGLIVPGVPTVPFLLATSYYLARSSPRLDERLRRTAFFGPILTEWETRGAVSRRSKGKLVGLTIVIVVITIAFASASPIAVVAILVVAAVSVFGVLRMPEFLDEQREKNQTIEAKAVIAAT